MTYMCGKRVLLLKMVFLSALVLSGCGEDAPVTNNDNSTNNNTTVFNDAPVGVINVSFQCGGVISLDSTGSHDPEGNPLSYKWMLVDAPAGSNLGASFANVSSSRVTTLVDKSGSYAFQLMLSDGSKQTLTQSVSIFATPPTQGVFDAGCTDYRNVAEFPVSTRGGVINARSDQPITVDARLANDSGATYQWSLVSSPVGSAVSLTAANTATPSLTPDLSGNYKLSLMVKKLGQAWAAAVVVVRASDLKAIPLAYQVTESDLLPGSNKIASISGDSTFRIHDLASGNESSIALPGSAVAFSISPDGSRALVLQKSLVSLINTNSHVLMSSWPLGDVGFNRVLRPISILMVNNQQAYIYAFDGASGYNKLYAFNAGSGSLGSAISGINQYSYSSSSRAILKRFGADTFFIANPDITHKVTLKPDGSVAQVYGMTPPDNCYEISFLSASLLARCGIAYSVSGSPPVLVFRNYIDSSQSQPDYLSMDGMVSSVDGLDVYSFLRYDYAHTGILKFRTDTWTLRSVIAMPAVDSGNILMPPAVNKILVDANNPLVIVARIPFYSGGYRYYLLKPY